MNTIFLCTTIKHLLLSVVFIFSHDIKKSKIFICYDHQDLKYSDYFFSILNDYGCEVIFINESELVNDFTANNVIHSLNGLLGRNFNLSSKYGFTTSSKYLKEKLNISGKDVSLYLFHDRTFVSKVLRNFKSVFMIEDGLANYSSKPIVDKLKMFLRFFLRLPIRYYVLGESKKISKIFAYHPERLPDEVKHKAIPLFDCTKSLSKDKIPVISKLFKFDYSLEGKVFFLTQGLDVAGLCSRDEKINLYYNIIRNLVELTRLQVIIKLHPSENKEDYLIFESDFENLSIFDGKIPVELFGICTHTNIGHYFSLYTSSNLMSLGSTIEVENLVDSKLWSRFDLVNIESESISNLKRFFDNEV